MEPILLNEWMYDRGRGPELRRCRITVYDLIPYMEHESYTDARMLELWPVTAEELSALKQYILDHHDEVMAMNAMIDARLAAAYAAQQTPEFQEKMRQSRENFLLFQEWFAERKHRPELFTEVPGETRDDRRVRLFQAFNEWKADRGAEAIVSEGRQ